jgi:methyl-accepting chemotaxis protein
VYPNFSVHGGHADPMSINNLCISRKLVLGFACVLVALGLTSLAIFAALRPIEQANINIMSASSARNDLNQMKAALEDQAAAVSSLALQYDQRHAQSYRTAQNEFDAALSAAHGHMAAILTVDEAEALLSGAKQTHMQWREEIGDRVVSLAKELTTAGEARRLSESPASFAAHQRSIEALGQVVAKVDTYLTEAQQSASAEIRFARDAQVLGGIIAILAALGVNWWLTREIGRPLNEITEAMKKLASGDHAFTIHNKGRKDEIGHMADAVETFRQAAIEKARLEAEAAAAREAAEVERQKQEKENQYYVDAHNAFMTSFKNALGKLAAGNLTFRITETYTEDYESIRADFNTAAEKLQQAMQAINSSTAAIRSSTTEISSAAEDQSRRTEQQAANLEQTAAALDEITVTVRKTSEGASHARDVVSTAKTDAERSSEVVRQAIDAMSEIEKSSQQISRIIGVIDEIAFQTNLLALNAGVEAARAGDAGRGFAVVASEVRALAQRSAEAAREIKGLISASTAQVSQGVDLVAQTGNALQRILEQVSEINTAVSEIAAGAKEQAIGLQEINTAVNQADQVTQQNAATMEETTAASMSLAREIDELMNMVANFEVGASTVVQPMARKPQQQATRTALKNVGSRGSSAVRKPQVAAETESWEEF